MRTKVGHQWVTHVFVNDPSAGYGTFIEWMLKDADVQTIADTLKGTAFFILVKDCHYRGGKP